ncbi:MAG TPA: hypothetical protein VFV35_06825 [Acidimicrobiales bacterium]|nr:hypothetical protein [Acidimicrobiales bacterium]
MGNYREAISSLPPGLVEQLVAEGRVVRPHELDRVRTALRDSPLDRVEVIERIADGLLGTAEVASR